MVKRNTATIECNSLCSWLKANTLSLNVAKTEFMVISTRQKFFAENCSEINIQLESQPISRVEHTKSLGLIIDDRLSWSYHIRELCRKISSAIGALKRIRFNPTSFRLLCPRLGWIEFLSM